VAAEALNYFAYNFIKIHRTLRTSPAMGAETRLWSVEDSVEDLVGEIVKTAEGGGKRAIKHRRIKMQGLFQPIHLLLIATIGFVVLAPFWQIFKKAGFSPWLSLLTTIPIVNLFVFYYVAFARWPEKPK
jgi:hypothetical protein